MIVVGIVGRQNSGKDALADALRDNGGFHKLSTGDIVRKLAERECVPRTREKLQDVASELIARRGPDYLAGLLVRRIEANDWPRVAITGLRTPADVTTLRDRFGDAFLLVRVTVRDPRQRFERGTKRGKPRDTESYERFLEHDRAEQELFDLDQTLSMADLTIENDGTLEEFHREIDEKILNRVKGRAA